MIQFDKIFVVRHGNYLRNPERLTEEGKADSEYARDTLIERGVGTGAVLLSSSAPRALQTAAIIGEGISLEVTPSERINIIGNDPDGVASFDNMLEAALDESGVDKSGDSLVVVAHQPLVDIVARRRHVGYGAVYPYTLGTWSNQKYNEREEQYLQKSLERAGLNFQQQ